MPTVRNRLLRTLPLLLALVAAVPLRAQVSPSMDSPNTPTGEPEKQQPGDADKPTDETQMTPFKGGTTLVNLFFTVRDKSGVPDATLTQGDCTVSEDKQPRPLKNFGLVRDQHLTLGVLLDISYSQRTVLGMEQEAGKQFLRQVLDPKTDQAFVMTVGANADLVQDYTSSLHRLDQALDKAQINAGGATGGDFIPGLSKPKGTVLYDAVYLAGHDEFKEEAGRHAMVMLTDGDDEGSDMKLQQAIEAAERADALVFVLLMYDPQAYMGTGGMYHGDHDIRKLAEATGGHVYVIGHDPRKLEKAFDDLSTALHSEYTATFVPGKLDGKYHPLEVQCKGEGRKVEARKGYYAVVPTD
jgi:VWFA-related protein